MKYSITDMCFHSPPYVKFDSSFRDKIRLLKKTYALSINDYYSETDSELNLVTKKWSEPDATELNDHRSVVNC